MNLLLFCIFLSSFSTLPLFCCSRNLNEETLFASSSDASSKHDDFHSVNKFPTFAYGKPEAVESRSEDTDGASLDTCPSAPLSRCDFYFDGFETEVPVFDVRGVESDSPISPEIASSRRYPSFLGLGSTSTAEFKCSGEFRGNSSGAFYVAEQETRIRFRKTSETLQDVLSRCVIFRFRDIRFRSEQRVLALKPGDGNAMYPETRRCVVFKTAPDPPSAEKCAAFPRNYPTGLVPKLKLTNVQKVLEYAKLNRFPRYTSLSPHFIPASVNWNHPKYISSVDEQEKRGNCWALSALAAVESAINIYAGKTAVRKLSVQELDDCLNEYGDGCDGGLPEHALEYISRYQIASEADYPTAYSKATCNRARSNRSTHSYPIVGWEHLEAENYVNLLKAVSRQPVVIAISTFMKEFKSYSGGIFDDPAGDCGGQQIPNHNLLLLGYGTDPESGTDFWVARNSWGPQWGEKGTIRIARRHYGEGVCGMYTVPPIYPVVSPVAGGHKACERSNPCGGGTCMPVEDGNSYTCSCPAGFMAVNNTADRHQTCTKSNPCENVMFNPCGVGKCMPDGEGGYQCDCSTSMKGYVAGELTDGTFTCIPAARAAGVESNYTYSIQKNDSCDSISEGFGLTKQQLQNFNPDLNCSVSSLPSDLNVHVRSNSNGRESSCILPYVLRNNDTCLSIQNTFNITLAAINSLNPEFDCTQINPGSTICLQNGEYIDRPCGNYNYTRPNETCEIIYTNANISASQFYALNLGINCDYIQPEQRVSVLPNEPKGAEAWEDCQKYYCVTRGDNCMTVIMDHYKCYSSLFLRMNGFWCSGSLPIGCVCLGGMCQTLSVGYQRFDNLGSVWFDLVWIGSDRIKLGYQ